MRPVSRYGGSFTRQSTRRGSSCFFFSSRRRHTRFDCDWSSDVCSSDLDMLERLEPELPAIPRYLMGVGFPEDLVAAVERGVDLFDCVAPTRNGRNGSAFKIGRTAGRGKGEISVVAGSLKKKNT